MALLKGTLVTCNVFLASEAWHFCSYYIQLKMAAFQEEFRKGFKAASCWKIIWQNSQYNTYPEGELAHVSFLRVSEVTPFWETLLRVSYFSVCWGTESVTWLYSFSEEKLYFSSSLAAISLHTDQEAIQYCWGSLS